MDSNTSKEKKNAPKSKSRKHLQLYLASHKSDLAKLFQNVKLFQLDENDQNIEQCTGGDVKLENLSNVSDNEYTGLPEDDESADRLISNLSLNDPVGLTCKTCDVNFMDVQDQRAHFRLDWHRYNVKRRIHQQKPVGDVEFDEMMDGLSSISGSDDNEESESAATKEQVARLLDKVDTDLDESNKKERKESRTIRKLTTSPKVFFENSEGQIFGIFKAALPEAGPDKLKSKDYDLHEFLRSPPTWGVILASSGHFAGAVFEGAKEIIHKTFHSYTVRAKQGGAESSSGLHKSAGSNLRRHNEASLFQNIQDTMNVWKPYLGKCQCIFYRMGSSNQNVFFGGKNPPLQRSDKRLKSIPFATKRPTFSEVKNVHTRLSSVQVFDKEVFLSQFTTVQKDETITDVTGMINPKAKSRSERKSYIDRCRSRSPPDREVPGNLEFGSEDESSSSEDVVDLIQVHQEIDFRELQEFDVSFSGAPNQRQRSSPKRRKPPKIIFQKPGGLTGELIDLLNLPDDAESKFTQRLKDEFSKSTDSDHLESISKQVNELVDSEGSTLLHVVTKKAQLPLIWCLLECGSSPSVKDKSGKYAFNYAETKEGRNLFRKFRAQYPDKYNYEMSQIPGPLTEQMEHEKAEKKRLLNKLKREKEKQKKMERKEKQEEINEKERFLNLSDREKRALAAEKRRLLECQQGGEKKPVLVRCFECAIDISGKVPFEYNGNVFCTTKCLASHRKKFPTPLSV